MLEKSDLHPLTSSDSTDMVTIIVRNKTTETLPGKDYPSQVEEEQSFLIHKEKLCSCSPFFEAAFKGNFLEAQTKSMILEGVDPKAFSDFLDWVYTSADYLPSVLKRLLPLWLLAQRFMIPALQNRIMCLICYHAMNRLEDKCAGSLDSFGEFLSALKQIGDGVEVLNKFAAHALMRCSTSVLKKLLLFASEEVKVLLILKMSDEYPEEDRSYPIAESYYVKETTGKTSQD